MEHVDFISIMLHLVWCFGLVDFFWFHLFSLFLKFADAGVFPTLKTGTSLPFSTLLAGMINKLVLGEI